MKLQSKAQLCVSRDKAVKILKKSDKAHKKMTKMSEVIALSPGGGETPVGGRACARIWVPPLASLAPGGARGHVWHAFTSEREARAALNKLIAVTVSRSVRYNHQC